MTPEKTRQALDEFQKISTTELDNFIKSVTPECLEAAAEIVIKAKENGNRMHITGIGKPSHVAEYMASLFSSTGTPTYYLHGTEAVHGSCGQLVAGDVVICISNSGETAELKSTVAAIKNNGCHVIAVTGNPESWLAKEAEATLPAGVSQEGGPLNRAPRASILAEIFVLQALSVYLQAERGLSPQEYVRWHPGGTLGHLRADEK
jgi:D-arabinose 5-phosphate isomerase GutQ